MNGMVWGLGVLALAAAWPLGAAPEAEEDGRTGRDPGRRAGLGGSVRGGLWSSSRDLDDRGPVGTAALWLEATSALGPGVSGLLAGWVRSDDLVEAEAIDGALREAYLDLRLGPLDFRVGRQIIAWGRADRINPTDNLTPRDFTLLVPEDDDQRLGVAGLRATYFLGSVGVTGIWLPEFEPHALPDRGGPPGVPRRVRRPAEPAAQWAVRLEQTGRSVDWSLSYFDGLDLFPDVALARRDGAPAGLVTSYRRLRVIGADAAATLGSYGLRGEAAYTLTEDTAGRDPGVKNPVFFLVLGADRTFVEYLNVNVQYFTRVVAAYRSPWRIADPEARGLALTQAAASGQLDRVQHGLSLRVAHKWLNETLEGEVAAVVLLTRVAYGIRPRVAYALTDRWKVTIGAELFGGSRRSWPGTLRENSTVYLEVRWGF